MCSTSNHITEPYLQKLYKYESTKYSAAVSEIKISTLNWLILPLTMTEISRSGIHYTMDKINYFKILVFLPILLLLLL